ncbi:hypothetical protein Dimus_025671 [Dionaea muscipula]
MVRPVGRNQSLGEWREEWCRKEQSVPDLSMLVREVGTRVEGLQFGTQSRFGPLAELGELEGGHCGVLSSDSDQEIRLVAVTSLIVPLEESISLSHREGRIRCVSVQFVIIEDTST